MRRVAALTLVLLSIGATACATKEAPPVDVPRSTPSLAAAGQRSALPDDEPRVAEPAVNGEVKLQLTIPKRYFEEGVDVIVTVWNPAQMKLREAGGSCSVSVDASGAETTTCPPGVVYTKPTPETFKVAYAELDGSVVLDVKSLALGEQYEVNVTGSASDGCNHTAAETRGVANPRIELPDLQYATTEMACSEG